MGTRYAKKDAALWHVQRGESHARAAEIVGTAEHIVERWCRHNGVMIGEKRQQKRAPYRPRVDVQPAEMRGE